MTNTDTYTLINPNNGNLAFKLLAFDGNSHFDHLQRNNYYSLIWITEGEGALKADFTTHQFSAGMLFAFSPYQPFMINEEGIRGLAIHFHPDFFCIHKHQAEVACNGVLFNNIYEPPYIVLDTKTVATLELIIGQMKTEIQNASLGQYELLVSYLKIFLITTSRIKVAQQPQVLSDAEGIKEPFILRTLMDSIEQNFKSKHSAGEYAEVLNVSPKTLAKITKTHFNKTISDLISERIIIEAKRELYLTNKTVKEIAWELGYPDEYYFSRFFKTNADVSPQLYRETVGFGRGA